MGKKYNANTYITNLREIVKNVTEGKEKN